MGKQAIILAAQEISSLAFIADIICGACAMHPARLIIIRHGETDFNAEGRFQGHIDRPLNATGIAQAEAVARRIAGMRADTLYCSDLLRAQQTARIVGQTHGLTPCLDPKLRERHLGVIQGLTAAEAMQQIPDVFHSYKQGIPDYVVPQGESRQQFQDRTIAALTEIASANQQKHVLVIAHGGTIDCIFRHTCGIPLTTKRHWRLWNAGINTFSCDAEGNWRLETWGDIAHMDASLAGDDY